MPIASLDRIVAAVFLVLAAVAAPTLARVAGVLLDGAPRRVVPDVGRPAAAAPHAARILFGDPLDLNRATADDLRALPGIGAARARRIVELRDARGGFRSPHELDEVSGIGPATLSRIAPYVEARPP